MSAERERAVRAVITDIAEGRMRPGDPLPGEIGDTLGDLVELGFASVSPEGLTTVSPEARWDVLDPRVLTVLLDTEQGVAVLREYVEYRRVVEVTAAGLAAENATPADLLALSTALADMTAAAEDRFHEADLRFHQALVAASGNRPLAQAAGSVQPALCTARRMLARPGLRLEHGLPEHQRILAAVEHGDADAAREAMSAHLDTVESYLREYAG